MSFEPYKSITLPSLLSSGFHDDRDHLRRLQGNDDMIQDRHERTDRTRMRCQRDDLEFRCHQESASGAAAQGVTPSSTPLTGVIILIEQLVSKLPHPPPPIHFGFTFVCSHREQPFQRWAKCRTCVMLPNPLTWLPPRILFRKAFLERVAWEPLLEV
jgi:hypothetical protein